MPIKSLGEYKEVVIMGNTTDAALVKGYLEYLSLALENLLKNQTDNQPIIQTLNRVISRMQTLSRNLDNKNGIPSDLYEKTFNDLANLPETRKPWEMHSHAQQRQSQTQPTQPTIIRPRQATISTAGLHIPKGSHYETMPTTNYREIPNEPQFDPDNYRPIPNKPQFDPEPPVVIEAPRNSLTQSAPVTHITENNEPQFNPKPPVVVIKIPRNSLTQSTPVTHLTENNVNSTNQTKSSYAKIDDVISPHRQTIPNEVRVPQSTPPHHTPPSNYSSPHKPSLTHSAPAVPFASPPKSTYTRPVSPTTTTTTTSHYMTAPPKLSQSDNSQPTVSTQPKHSSMTKSADTTHPITSNHSTSFSQATGTDKKNKKNKLLKVFSFNKDSKS